MNYTEAKQIKRILDVANKVVVLQADNPDADSLASALALEEILSELGKTVFLYCGADIPSYLKYLKGWDRVNKDLPTQFDASIIVDTSAISLFENLQGSGQLNWIASKPCIVLDHHAVDASILFATVICNKPAVATGEVIYELADDLNWPLNNAAKKLIATSIMSDSLGLVSEGTSARSIHIVAELVEDGVSLAELENTRKEMMQKSIELIRYKGRLLQRIEYFSDNRIATVTIPWEEIEQFSNAYNPSMLVIDDMRMTQGTEIAIAFKLYRDGKITAKIRANFNKAIAGDLATHFGGGGHKYASGFKVADGRRFEDIKAETIAKATELLDKLEKK